MARSFETAVQVELVVQSVAPPPLDELKAAAQAAIDADPESFEELSGKSAQWCGDTLPKASTPREVIRVFSALTIAD